MEKDLNIVMISTFPPKECGVATYARNLFDALKKEYKDLKIIVLAVDEMESEKKYPIEVKQIIKKENVAAYEKAADYINNSGANLVYLQHEFGIYGGFDGILILKLLEKLKVPVVVSLHAVPITKKAKRRTSRIKILKDILKHSKRVILTTNFAEKILLKEAGLPERKVRVIFHGTPDVQFEDQKSAKKNLKLENKKVLSTIGMISNQKGIDTMVEALPSIIKKHKNVVYLIVGKIHSAVRRETEVYLRKVMARAKDLKVDRNILRVDQYLSEEKFISYFKASDVVLTLNKIPEQVSSGTLAYAIACGRCVVSTPYIYAKELIGENARGFLVKFGDLSGIARKINYVLDHPLVQKEMEKKIYEFGRKTTWPVVAKQHFEVFEEAVSDFF